MPSTWNGGPPWRDLPNKGSYRCNILRTEPVELQPCKSGLPTIRQAGLGQGVLEQWNNGIKTGKTNFNYPKFP